MRASTDYVSTVPSITDNCPLCHNSPGEPEHILQKCPVVVQLGLQFPDTMSPPPPTFRPATEHPPPFPPTTPTRLHDDSNDQGSISESI